MVGGHKANVPHYPLPLRPDVQKRMVRSAFVLMMMPVACTFWNRSSRRMQQWAVEKRENGGCFPNGWPAFPILRFPNPWFSKSGREHKPLMACGFGRVSTFQATTVTTSFFVSSFTSFLEAVAWEEPFRVRNSASSTKTEPSPVTQTRSLLSHSYLCRALGRLRPRIERVSPLPRSLPRTGGATVLTGDPT